MYNFIVWRCGMATVALRALGGSVVMALPKQVLNMLHLCVGSQVEVSVEGGRLVVEPKHRTKYRLSELLAQCNEENMALSAEDREWVNAKALGKEAPL
jgi:antitoxin ChpS